MSCQLCGNNKQEWAAIVSILESIEPIYKPITHEGEYEYPMWLICSECKDTGKVIETRKKMLNFEIDCNVEELEV